MDRESMFMHGIFNLDSQLRLDDWFMLLWFLILGSFAEFYAYWRTTLVVANEDNFGLKIVANLGLRPGLIR